MGAQDILQEGLLMRVKSIFKKSFRKMKKIDRKNILALILYK